MLTEFVMVISRNDLEFLDQRGWIVIVTNGNTSIQKEGYNRIDNQSEIMTIIKEEQIEENKELFKLVSQYIIIFCFFVFNIFNLISL